MSIWAWLILVLCVLIAGFYTYDYFTMPSISNITTANSCINANDLDTFGLFKQANYELYLPKDWPFVKFSTEMPNTHTFGINQNDNAEFLSIWSSDYNKTSDELIFDTLQPLNNYVIDSKTKLKTNNGEELTKAIASFKTDSGIVKQEIYAYTNNGKGYLILIRLRNFDYNSFLPTLNKITCSFKTK